MSAAQLTIGISLAGTLPQGIPPIGSLLRAARHAESSGFDALWCGDHVMMYNPVLEPITLLSAFAAVTERVRLGTSVYLLPLRHPVVTAKMFAGLDHVSGGRLVFGVGVGGEYPREFDACGVPVAERGSRTDEGLEIVRALWSGSAVTFHGRHYRLDAVTLAPPPIQRPGPPIWVGGRSPAALRRTARFGDGWLAYMVTPARMREGLDAIRDEAARQGRTPAAIAGGLLLFIHVGRDRETARRRVVADLSSRYNQPFESIVDRYCAFGSAADCAAFISRFVEAGATNLVFKFTCAPDEQLDQQAAFAEEILPLIRRAAPRVS